MRIAVEEAQRARGTTGDNPWVGCVIVQAGELVGRGHTLGPGEDHAEVAAARDAHARGCDIRGATLYSTLEPCSFHGRTPSCARAIAERGIAIVVFGMHDPNPRVDGEGARILRAAGVEVVEGIGEVEVRRQLGDWVILHHPHEPRRRFASMSGSRDERIGRLAELYAVEAARIRSLLEG